MFNANWFLSEDLNRNLLTYYCRLPTSNMFIIYENLAVLTALCSLEWDWRNNLQTATTAPQILEASVSLLNVKAPQSAASSSVLSASSVESELGQVVQLVDSFGPSLDEQGVGGYVISQTVWVFLKHLPVNENDKEWITIHLHSRKYEWMIKNR